MSRRMVAGSLALGLFAATCSGGGGTGPAAAAPTAADRADAGAGSDATEPPPAPPSARTVQLLDPGAPPRRAFRFGIARPNADYVVKTSAGGPGSELRITGPLRVTRSSGTDAAAELDLRLGPMDVRARAVSPVARADHGAARLALRVSATGAASGHKLHVPAPRGPATDLLLALSDALDPVPSEPIGLGASWRVDSEADGLRRIAEYEVYEIIEHGFRARVRIEHGPVDDADASETMAGKLQAHDQWPLPELVLERVQRLELVERDGGSSTVEMRASLSLRIATPELADTEDGE